jgi:hypothetical protein
MVRRASKRAMPTGASEVVDYDSSIRRGPGDLNARVLPVN